MKTRDSIELIELTTLLLLLS
uniref:Activating transcription factor of chaperone isoform x2 n=1 Tax=Triatoma infestans TaxID=30076 RepID=A0A171B4C7_TRIIF